MSIIARNRENPKWTLMNSGRNQVVSRFNSTLNVGFKINDFLHLKYRGGLQQETVLIVVDG